ncbi:MAG: hypothetical protein HC925_00155 [Coleofasciculaceae cyanobacterium SM2_3_26]|nr:hypothetical protein [Coleofasciculaceae cyanobacterium SM2_3_26]
MFLLGTGDWQWESFNASLLVLAGFEVECSYSGWQGLSLSEFGDRR